MNIITISFFSSILTLARLLILLCVFFSNSIVSRDMEKFHSFLFVNYKVKLERMREKNGKN